MQRFITFYPMWTIKWGLFMNLNLPTVLIFTLDYQTQRNCFIFAPWLVYYNISYSFIIIRQINLSNDQYLKIKVHLVILSTNLIHFHHTAVYEIIPHLKFTRLFRLALYEKRTASRLNVVPRMASDAPIKGLT